MRLDAGRGIYREALLLLQHRTGGENLTKRDEVLVGVTPTTILAHKVVEAPDPAFWEDWTCDLTDPAFWEDWEEAWTMEEVEGVEEVEDEGEEFRV